MIKKLILSVVVAVFIAWFFFLGFAAISFLAVLPQRLILYVYRGMLDPNLVWLLCFLLGLFLVFVPKYDDPKYNLYEKWKNRRKNIV